jgi:ABC-type uncharacterized transport system fused permease/ATPase subunit
MPTKKELKEQYRQSRPDMGVFAYRCLPTGKVYIGFGQNVKAEINSTTFKLNFGNYNTNSNLQNNWKEYGENNFEIAVLELLEYDRDESKTDYTQDLRVLREFCSEKFDQFEFIKK